MLIAQVTDVHLGFEPNNPAEFNRQRLDQVIRKLKTTEPVPDMLIISGDLVDRGDVESYKRLRSVIDGCGFPTWPHKWRCRLAQKFQHPAGSTRDGARF